MKRVFVSSSISVIPNYTRSYDNDFESEKLIFSRRLGSRFIEKYREMMNESMQCSALHLPFKCNFAESFRVRASDAEENKHFAEPDIISKIIFCSGSGLDSSFHRVK